MTRETTSGIDAWNGEESLAGCDPFDAPGAIVLPKARRLSRRMTLGALLCGGLAVPAWAQKNPPPGTTPDGEPVKNWVIQPPTATGSMLLVRVYAEPSGRTRIEQRMLELSPQGNSLLEQAAETVALRVMPPSMSFDWHKPSRRRLVALLRGKARMTLRDGTQAEVVPGALLLVENTTGEGHRGEFGIDGEYVVTFDVGLPKSAG